MMLSNKMIRERLVQQLPVYGFFFEDDPEGSVCEGFETVEAAIAQGRLHGKDTGFEFLRVVIANPVSSHSWGWLSTGIEVGIGNDGGTIRRIRLCGFPWISAPTTKGGDALRVVLERVSVKITQSNRAKSCVDLATRKDKIMDLMLNRSIVPMPNNTELGTNIVGMNVDDAVTTLEGGKVPFLGAEEFSFFQSLSSENRAKFVLNRIEALTAINGQARASAHVGCASLLKSIAAKYPQLHHDYYYLFQTNSGASIALNRHERRAQAKRQKLAR